MELKSKEFNILKIIFHHECRVTGEKQLARPVMAENQVNIHTPRKGGNTYTYN